MGQQAAGSGRKAVRTHLPSQCPFDTEIEAGGVQSTFVLVGNLGLASSPVRDTPYER
jgi:hypothetical protein